MIVVVVIQKLARRDCNEDGGKRRGSWRERASQVAQTAVENLLVLQTDQNTIDVFHTPTIHVVMASAQHNTHRFTSTIFSLYITCY